MIPERSKGAKKQIRNFKREARALIPEWEIAQRYLSLQIPNFNEDFGALIPVIRDWHDTRLEIERSGNYGLVEEFRKKYEDPNAARFDPKHPNVFDEIKPVRDAIRDFYKH